MLMFKSCFEKKNHQNMQREADLCRLEWILSVNIVYRIAVI